MTSIGERQVKKQPYHQVQPIMHFLTEVIMGLKHLEGAMEADHKEA